MEIFIWICIIILFVLSFIGLMIPIIPGVFLIWAAFLIYHFTLAENGLSLWLWFITLGLTVILIVADFISNHYFIEKLGGTKASQWGALFGVLIGIFVYPPIGLIIIPFLIVFLIELSYRKTPKKALQAALGALAGFLSGAIAKGLIQFAMIVAFLIYVYFN